MSVNASGLSLGSDGSTTCADIRSVHCSTHEEELTAVTLCRFCPLKLSYLESDATFSLYLGLLKEDNTSVSG